MSVLHASATIRNKRGLHARASVIAYLHRLASNPHQRAGRP